MCSLATPFAAPAPSCVYVHRPSALLRQPCPAAAAKQHEFRPFICQSGIRGRRSRGIIAPCRAQKDFNLAINQSLNRAETLYQVLGVTEEATTKDIKSAYRKKAMKLHPDVNKAPNAKEQFMECKTAYDTLIDEKSRKQYDRARMGGSGFGIGGDFGADWDSFGKYARDAANASTYSYNDLVRDLDREIESWQQERQKKKGKRAEDISDVVGDLADDFLEFLEMEAGIPLGKTASKTSGDKDNADYGTAGSSSRMKSGSSQQTSKTSYSQPASSRSGEAQTRTQGTQTDEKGRTQEDDVVERAKREAAAAVVRASRIAELEAERVRKEAQKAGEVEDDLAELKRKLGL